MKELFLFLIIIFLAGCIDSNHSELPNPSAVYCEERGFTYESRKSDLGEYGVCKFNQSAECPAWDYYHNTCNPANHYIVCTLEQKGAEACTMNYLPVCGDNDKTYSNSCVACSSTEINSYKNGACEK